MAQIIKLKEVEPENIPGFGGLQLWNPAYRNETIEQLEKKTREYLPVYNFGVFCRKTATIHLYINHI